METWLYGFVCRLRRYNQGRDSSQSLSVFQESLRTARHVLTKVCHWENNQRVILQGVSFQAYVYEGVNV